VRTLLISTALLLWPAMAHAELVNGWYTVYGCVSETEDTCTMMEVSDVTVESNEAIIFVCRNTNERWGWEQQHAYIPTTDGRLEKVTEFIIQHVSCDGENDGD